MKAPSSTPQRTVPDPGRERGAVIARALEEEDRSRDDVEEHGLFDPGVLGDPALGVAERHNGESEARHALEEGALRVPDRGHVWEHHNRIRAPEQLAVRRHRGAVHAEVDGHREVVHRGLRSALRSARRCECVQCRCGVIGFHVTCRWRRGESLIVPSARRCGQKENAAEDPKICCVTGRAAAPCARCAPPLVGACIGSHAGTYVWSF